MLLSLAGVSLETVSAGVALAAVAVAAVYDFRQGRIPDVLNGIGLVVGLVLAGVRSVDALGTALLAGAVAASALYGVRLLGEVVYKQPGMGWGDVKLAAVLGVLMGWNALWALYLAAVLGAIVGVGGRALGRTGQLQRVPFAPFIAAGSGVATWLPLDTLWTVLIGRM